MAETDHKTALITGANGFLGLAIAKRLISSLPDETRITIIVSSRTFPNVKQAVTYLKEHAVPPGRKGLVEFDYVTFDQMNMVSVLSAVRDLELRYNKIDYVYLNACYTMFDGIDWAMAAKEMFTNPMESFTVGSFKKQRLSRVSNDGIGSVFQANVFAPWFIIRRLVEKRTTKTAVVPDLPLLRDGSKVFWISSIASSTTALDMDDIELTRTLPSYEASKRLLDLLHQATFKMLKKSYGVQSILVEPGIFKSTSYVPTLNIITYWGMMMTFYLLRWLGSPHHNIDPYKAASALVFLALQDDIDLSIKYGSATYRNGSEYLYKQKVPLVAGEEIKVYEYLEGLYKQWNERLKDQVIDRYLF